MIHDVLEEHWVLFLMLSSRCKIFTFYAKIRPFRILIRFEEDSNLTIFAGNNESTLLRAFTTCVRHVFIACIVCSTIRVDCIDRERFLPRITGRNTLVITTRLE